MGLLSRLFPPRPKKTFPTEKLGVFTLVYSKRGRNNWTNDSVVTSLSVGGTEDSPNQEHITFLTCFKDEVNLLSDKITKKIKREFREAELEASFTSWEERFKIVAASVGMLYENEAYWDITFEDLESPYAHFTLFIEGQKLTDFSIDT